MNTTQQELKEQLGSTNLIRGDKEREREREIEIERGQ